MADNHFKIRKGSTHFPQSSAPSNPINGDMYYDSTLNRFRGYQDGSWQNLIAGNPTYNAQTASYTLLDSDEVVVFTAGASALTATLPNTASLPTGKTYVIKKADSGTGRVVIDADGSQTIDGQTTLELRGDGNFVQIVNNGTNWDIIALDVTEIMQASAAYGTLTVPAVNDWEDAFSLPLRQGTWNLTFNVEVGFSNSVTWRIGISDTMGNVSPGVDGIDHTSTGDSSAGSYRRTFGWSIYEVEITSPMTYFAKIQRNSSNGNFAGGVFTAVRIK